MLAEHVHIRKNKKLSQFCTMLQSSGKNKMHVPTQNMYYAILGDSTHKLNAFIFALKMSIAQYKDD